ncbi:MAG: DUF1552 domain-containing protein, partial [Myxococcota bacterium]
MKISRRNLIRSGAAAAAASPFLLPTRRIQANSDGPRRVVIIFSPNGPQHERGPTEGTEDSFTIHDWWSPLERHRARGIFFRDVHQAGVPFGNVDEYGHQSGSVGALTATCTEGTRTATGPSLDQFIGQQLEASGVITPKRSLTFGLYDRARPPFFERAGQAVLPITNPYDGLAEIAPSFGGDGPTMVNQALQRQHFVLDHIYGDCQRLRGRLGAEGREILDRHCADIETLEQSISASMTPRLTCEMPSGPISPQPMDHNWVGREARDDAMDAFTDLMALSFVCDVTRVVSVGFGNGASRFSIPESYNVPESPRVDSGDSGPQMHAWTHRPKDDPNTLPAMKIFYNWFSERVATIIDKLETTMDADGRPLIESTLVLWTSEFGAGGPHTNANVPVMLFGDSCGRYRTGRHFQAEGDRNAKAMVLHELFVSIIRHMGLDSIDR